LCGILGAGFVGFILYHRRRKRVARSAFANSD
jgi:hypothetical protein